MDSFSRTFTSVESPVVTPRSDALPYALQGVKYGQLSELPTGLQSVRPAVEHAALWTSPASDDLLI
jgi:hypothetical protein